MDFLSQTDSMLLGGEMIKVPKSQHWKDIIIPESQWFNVNEQQAYKAMKYCFENYNDVKDKALNLMKVNREATCLRVLDYLRQDDIYGSESLYPLDVADKSSFLAVRQKALREYAALAAKRSQNANTTAYSTAYSTGYSISIV